MSKIKILIELDKEIYKDVKESVYNVDSNYIEIGHAIGDGKVLPKTRKEVHKMLFGIDPPELGSPYCSCADGGDGCEFCRHKEDQNCDVQWWNAEMPMSAADMRKEQTESECKEPKEERINFAERIKLVNNAVEKTTAKWKQAIEDIKAEIEKITPKVVHDHNEMKIYNVRKYDIEIIDKHTKELM